MVGLECRREHAPIDYLLAIHWFESRLIPMERKWRMMMPFVRRIVVTVVAAFVVVAVGVSVERALVARKVAEVRRPWLDSIYGF